MTDKVQKIKEWISKEQDGLMDAQGNFGYPEHEGAFHILSNLDYYIDSLQEEPVSEDLEEAASSFARKDSEGISNPANFYYTVADKARIFKSGAKWQIARLMKDAIDVAAHIDAGGYPYIPQMELYDYDKDVPLAKEGDKYKAILIKEE